MTATMNIKRVVATVMLALAMMISMTAYTAVDAKPASAHAPCSKSSWYVGNYHKDWHTISWHYDYHRYYWDQKDLLHWHWWSQSYHQHWKVWYLNTTHSEFMKSICTSY